MFTEFRLSNWVGIPTGSTTSGNVDLKIKLSKTSITGTSAEIFPDIITLRAKRDGTTGKITDCFSIGTVSDSFWKIGTNPSDIQFSAGNVGIGTSSPNNLLEVNKNQNLGTAVRVENDNAGASAFSQFEVLNGSVSGAFGIEGTGRTGSFFNPSDTFVYGFQDMVLASVGNAGSIRFTTKNTPLERMRITSNGNVGIGIAIPAAKLDVAGEVKFGNTSSACNAANEGQQRYNSTSKVMEFCNGTSWAGYGAAVPSGTLCGFYDGYTNTATALCKGLNPNTGCPGGYTLVSVAYVVGTGWSQSCSKD